MRWLQRARAIWRAEKAKAAALRVAPLSDPKFHRLYKRAGRQPCCWVLSDGATIELLWLNTPFAQNWNRLRGLALAGFTPCGAIARIHGKIEMEIEEGRESIMAQARNDFIWQWRAAKDAPHAA